MKLYGFLKRFMAWLATVCCVKVWRYESSQGHIGVSAALCRNGCEVPAAGVLGQDPNPAGGKRLHGGHQPAPGLLHGPAVGFAHAVSNTQACALAPAVN